MIISRFLPSAERHRPVDGRSSIHALPSPYSRFAKIVMTACFVVSTLLALAATIFSIHELVVWGADWFGGEAGGWWAFLKCVLAGFSIVFCGRWLLMLVFVGVDFIQRKKRRFELTRWPKVSILLPAFNEEATLASTIESLLDLDYPDYEVIVVEDGSRDDTLRIAQRYAGRYPWGMIRAYHKPNGGKWTALNFAFQRSVGEIVVGIDADGALDRDALKRGVARMADPKVDAVAGYTRVMNRTNVLTHLQALEFVLWNGAIRIPQAQSGTVLCVPGPLGFFRRSTLEEVFLRFGRPPGPVKPGIVGGPFEGDTFAEDFDLTVTILMMGGKVDYEPLASCDTDAPESMFALLNQRYRWCRGSLQAIRKCFARAVAEPSYRHFRLFGWLTLSYLYDVATFVFALAANLIILTLALGGSDPESGEIFLAYAAIQIGFKVISALLFVLIHRESLKLLWMVPILEFYGSFILGGALVISVIDELRSRSMHW